MLKESWGKLSPMSKFLIQFCSLLVFWEVTYTFWLEKNGTIDFYLTSWVSDSSLRVLNWLGYEMTSQIGLGQCQVIYNEGVRLLHVAHPCNGLLLQVLFITFLLCFKGDRIIKLITIILGTTGIFIINVMRVVALLLIQLKYPEYLDFSHKWLFTVLVYAFVFSLWLFWVNKLSKLKFTTTRK